MCSILLTTSTSSSIPKEKSVSSFTNVSSSLHFSYFELENFILFKNFVWLKWKKSREGKQCFWMADLGKAFQSDFKHRLQKYATAWYKNDETLFFIIRIKTKYGIIIPGNKGFGIRYLKCPHVPGILTIDKFTLKLWSLVSFCEIDTTIYFTGLWWGLHEII